MYLLFVSIFIVLCIFTFVIVIVLCLNDYRKSPLYILPVQRKSNWSEQLNTTTYFPRALPMSLTVSVLPVPAGPAGAPPKHMPKA